MPHAHAARRARLGEAMVARGLDVILVTDLVNVRYLSGFSGSNGAVLVSTDGTAVLATDGRYQDQAADEAPDVDLVITRTLERELLLRAGSDVKGRSRVGFEDQSVTVATHAQLAALTSVELAPVGELVTEQRVVKDADEVAALREACRISDAALATLLTEVHAGQTERQVARRLENLMYDAGADALAFETIVASGPNSAVPHHQPTSRVIATGDFLKMDFGALCRGYHADMTRTVVVGPPARWQEELYLVVAAAQRAGREALREGVGLADVDHAARTVVNEAGLGEHFTHGLGHGVGLEIHEAPFLGTTALGKLRAGTPVTVEPGVYLPGRGGVRIEDTLLVGRRDAESLTTTTRELLVVG
jgi:Xaa-Pro aminopeptidase